MTMTRHQAKSHLKSLGWSQRRAAKELGVGQEHLNRVLAGRRDSRRLLFEIAKLPPSPTPYCHTGFAVTSNPQSK